MNQYYRFLNLPNDPLKDKSSILEKYSEKVAGYHLEDLSIVKDDVLECFSKIGLDPDFVVIFPAKINGEQDKRFIHSDISYNRETNKWMHVPLGVNWDIQGHGIFQWWNAPTNVKRIWPKGPPEDPVIEKLCGIHFSARRFLGIPTGVTLIDSVSTINPILVRTDIPHSVIYDTPRVCLSIRFKNTTNKKWDELYHLFDTIAK